MSRWRLRDVVVELREGRPNCKATGGLIWPVNVHFSYRCCASARIRGARLARGRHLIGYLRALGEGFKILTS